jgi:hypothetical protein
MPVFLPSVVAADDNCVGVIEKIGTISTTDPFARRTGREADMKFISAGQLRTMKGRYENG